jgi:hypothetical protein
MWNSYWTSFWEVTQCQWQKRLDPSFDTYASEGTATYNYIARLSESDVGPQMAAIATTGRIKRPLISVAGTLDALLPADLHARAYARQVRAQAGPGGAPDAGERAGDGGDHGGRHGYPGRWPREVPYRLYEVQNGTHLETLQDTFPEIELIMPHAWRAFDLLVRHLEQHTPLPPDQCIPRGGMIADAPADSGTCASLLVP